MEALKKQEITSVGKDQEKRNPRVLLEEMQIGAATVGNHMEVRPKIKNRNIT